MNNKYEDVLVSLLDRGVESYREKLYKKWCNAGNIERDEIFAIQKALKTVKTELTKEIKREIA